MGMKKHIVGPLTLALAGACGGSQPLGPVNPEAVAALQETLQYRLKEAEGPRAKVNVLKRAAHEAFDLAVADEQLQANGQLQNAPTTSPGFADAVEALQKVYAQQPEEVRRPFREYMDGYARNLEFDGGQHELLIATTLLPQLEDALAGAGRNR